MANQQLELEKRLKVALNSCDIENGYPNLSKDCKLWEFLKEVEKQLGKYLDFNQTWSIFLDIFGTTLGDRENLIKPNGKLHELIDSAKLINLQNNTLSFFESIPRPYSIYYRFSPVNKQKYGRKNFNFGEGLDFFKVEKGDDLSQMVVDAYDKRALRPNIALSSLLMNPTGKEPAFNEGDILLRVKAVGYAKDNINDFAISEALSKIKCVFHLGSIMDIFTVDLRSEGWVNNLGQKSCDLFFGDDTSKDKRLEMVDLPLDMSNQFARYSFKYSSDRGIPIPPQEVPNMEALQKIGNLLSAKEDDNATPIVTATQWAFDSLASPNETISFIQLCIGIESILGDNKTRNRVVEILSDRCAYLLGTTPKMRAYLKNKFTEIYEHRSQVVHGRKIRLEGREKDSLIYGEYLLAQIIKKEMSNFNPSNKK